jgi:hypothetical protein
MGAVVKRRKHQPRIGTTRGTSLGNVRLDDAEIDRQLVLERNDLQRRASALLLLLQAAHPEGGNRDFLEE